MIMKKGAARAALVALLSGVLVGLAACSGGGDPPTAENPPQQPENPQQPPVVATGTVQTYITDDLNTDFKKIWVGVRSISIVDTNGVSQTLYTPDGGATSVLMNLADLSNVGALLSGAAIPAGTYVKAVVTLDNELALEPANTAVPTIKANFGGSGSVNIDVPIDLTVSANAPAPLLIDFDLARWTYNAVSKRVTPLLVQRPKDDIAKFERTKIEVNGEVTAVNVGPGRLTVTSARFPKGVTVQTDDRFTTVFSGSNGSAASIAVGSRVEVQGNVLVDKGEPVIYAVAIKVKGAGETDADSAKVAKLTGTVLGTSGGLQLAVKDANFVPDAGSITVDISTAAYVRGTNADLVYGAEVRVLGQLTADGDFVAKFVDVAGGATADEKARNLVKPVFTGVAQVMGIVDGKATLRVLQFNGPSDVVVNPDDLLSVDIDGAIYATGDDSCLMNSTVNVVGVLDGNEFKARVLTVRGGCMGTLGDDGVRRIASNTGEPRGVGVLKEINLALNTYTLEVFEVHGFLPQSKTVVVQLNSDTKIDDSIGAPKIGDIAEVAGSWDVMNQFLIAKTIGKSL